MKLRPMALTDLDIIVEVEHKVFSDPWPRQSFEFEITKNRFSIPLVLEHQNEIIGYAIIWRIYEEFHIANIAIRPEHQGKKLGKWLLEKILNMADDARYAILEVREKNARAIKLYEKFGFNTIMKRPRYYQNGENALVMQKIFQPDRDNTSSGDHPQKAPYS